MLEKKLLGEKSGGGFYRRVKGPDGKKSIETLDLDSLEYREKQKAKFPEVETVRNLESLSERLPALVDVKGRAGEFTWKTAAVCSSTARTASARSATTPHRWTTD